MRTTQAPHADAKPDPHPHENPDADSDPHDHPDWHAHHDSGKPGSVSDRPANGNVHTQFHRLEVVLTQFHRLEDLGDEHAQLECLEDLGNQLTEFERVEVTEPDRTSVTHDRAFGVGVARFQAEH